MLKKRDFIVPDEPGDRVFNDTEIPFCICAEVIRKQKLNRFFSFTCRYTDPVYSSFQPCFTHKCLGPPNGNAYATCVYSAVMDVIEQLLDASGRVHLSGTAIFDLDTWEFTIYSKLMEITTTEFNGKL